jgi:hypothetical protein
MAERGEQMLSSFHLRNKPLDVYALNHRFLSADNADKQKAGITRVGHASIQVFLV